MKVFIILVIVGFVCGNLLDDIKFNAWQKEHKKTYVDNLEKAKRQMIFQSNLELIKDMNFHQFGGPYCEFGTNQFADLAPHEFKRKILMIETIPQPFENSRYLGKPNTTAPQEFDWRSKGAVTEVQDQGASGTCWAFSTTGSIEGRNFLKTGKLVKLSEEQLVDCDGTADPEQGRADCGVFGGWPYLAYKYIIKAGGIDPAIEYPYCVGGGSYDTSCFPCMAEGWTEKLCGPPPYFCDEAKWPCKKDRSQDAVVVSDWAAIGTNETEMAQHLVEQGPLSVGLNANMLQFYRRGIFDPRRCDPTYLNHAVLLVGYGDAKGREYWTIKNSWGLKWGESGFFRIAKGKGKCGINTIVATPIL